MTELRSEGVAREIEALRVRLSDDPDDGLVVGLVESLRTAVEELRDAEAAVARQNEELLALHEAQLEEAKRYRNLFESAPLAYITTDRRGKMVDANAAAAELLGVEVGSMLGRPLASYVDPADRKLFRRSAIELARGGGRVDMQIRMRGRNDVPFEAGLRATTVAGEVAWMIQEETKRRQAEEELRTLNRELEARVAARTGELEGILEQLPVGVVIVGASGSVARMNRRAREIAGTPGAWDAADPDNRLDRLHVDGTPMPFDEWPIVRALGGQIVPRGVYRLNLADGRAPVIEATAAPVVGQNGEILGAVTTFDDVTERESRERADREFVANAAHQIRTPITAIASSAAALNAGAIDEPAARAQFVAHIEADVRRLARLAEALLALARLQRGDDAPRHAEIVLRPMLERLVREAQVRGRVPCRLRCPASLTAWTHEGLLEEALASVLANATERTTEGDIRVTGRRLKGEVVIDVVDTGPGIDPADRPHVFTRFFRGGGRGSGLGLTIAAEAAHAAGASVELQSKIGVGTRVRFRLGPVRELR